MDFDHTGQTGVLATIYNVEPSVEKKCAPVQMGDLHFQRLVDNVPDMIFRYRLSPSSGYEYVNPAATALTGYTPEEFYASPSLMRDYLLHPLDQKRISSSSLDTWLAGEESRGTHQSYTLRFVHKNRHVLWVELHLVRLYGETGQLTAVEGIVRDVSRHERELEALRRSEERFRRVMHTTVVPFAITSLVDGKILMINQSGLELFGFTQEEMLGRTTMELDLWLTPADRQAVVADVVKLGHCTRDLWFQTRSGRLVHVQASFDAFEYDDMPCLLILMINITERKRMETALQASERLFRAVFEGALDAMVIIDDDGRYVDANPAACTLMGLPYEALQGRNGADFTVPDHDVDGSWLHFLQAGQIQRGEFYLRRQDGTVRETEYAATPNILPGRHLSVLRDVTKANQAARELQKRTGELKERVKALQCLFAITKLIGANRHATPDVLQAVVDLIPLAWRHPEQTYARIGHQQQTFCSQEFTETAWHLWQPLKVNGQRCGHIEVFVQVTAQTGDIPFSAEESELLVAVAQLLDDYLERHEAERQLRNSEQRYHQLIQMAPLGIAVFSPTGRLALSNPAFRELVGLKVPDRMENGVTHFLIQSGLMAAITRCITQAKQEVVEVNWSLVPLSTAQLRVYLVPLQHENGKVDAVQALFEDVTQYREHERQTSHRQKLEAVGALAAGIAHEINTPIQFIGDNTHFLCDAFADLCCLLALDQDCQPAGSPVPIQAIEREIDVAYLESEIPLALAQTLEGVERVASIVNAMRTFAHPVNGEKGPADLNEAIQNTLIVARNEYKYVADVVLDLDPGLPSVSCDLSEINQVVLNLLVNAAHAIRDKQRYDGDERGTITVCTRTIDGGVQISIADTGTGIAPEIKHRIFDPFFTTKPVGEGTGQGLAIVHSVIVKRHGGRIRLVTEVGQGTTFILWLPLDQSKEDHHG